MRSEPYLKRVGGGGGGSLLRENIDQLCGTGTAHIKQSLFKRDGSRDELAKARGAEEHLSVRTSVLLVVLHLCIIYQKGRGKGLT